VTVAARASGIEVGRLDSGIQFVRTECHQEGQPVGLQAAQESRSNQLPLPLLSDPKGAVFFEYQPCGDASSPKFGVFITCIGVNFAGALKHLQIAQHVRCNITEFDGASQSHHNSLSDP